MYFDGYRVLGNVFMLDKWVNDIRWYLPISKVVRIHIVVINSISKVSNV